MEILRLDKDIDNEKLDLEMTIAQLKKAKEKLSQSLKRRKDLAIQMNDPLYIEERIKDFHPSNNLDETSKQSKNSWKRMVHCKKEVREN